MSIPTYRYHVLFSGQLQPGCEREAVKRALATSLHLSGEKAEGLFAGRKRIMKRTESLAQAESFVQVFANAGAVATIETNDGRPVIRDNEGAGAVNGGAGMEAGDGADRSAVPYRPFMTNWLFSPVLFMATVIESLLTLVYIVALIASALLLFYHTLVADWLFTQLASPVLAALLAALLLVGGSLVLALLAKPLLSLARRKEPHFELNREVEPEFFSYVEEIAALVGTAAPVTIRVNHSSQLTVRPLWSWQGVGKRHKVLTIGLPLLAGLDSRQMAALLAQAFAPWRPGVTRVVGQLLDGNLRWLYRAGYERDVVDRALHDWQVSLPRLARGIEPLKRVAAWSGLPARARLTLSRFLSRRLLHRLLADGDRVACQVAGNEALRSALRQSRLIAFAAQNTLPALEKLWQEKGALPDNLAQAVVARASHYPPQTQLRLEEMEIRRNVESGGFKPTTQQRIAWFDAAMEAGSYDIAVPCAAYFRRLEKLMHVLAITYYHNHLKIAVTTNKLTRTPSKGSQEYEANQRIGRFFGAVYADFVPLRLKGRVALLSKDGAELSRGWQEEVGRVLAEQHKTKLAASTLQSHDAELIELSNRELLQRSGIGSMLSGLTRLKGRAAEELQQECRNAEERYEAGVAELERLYKPYAERLATALALLNSSTVQQRMFDAGQRFQEVEQLLVVHERIENNYAKLRELRLQTILLESLLSYQSIKSNAKLHDRIREVSDDISRTLANLAVYYKQTPYPFETEEHYANLFDWVLAQAADGEGPAAEFDRGNDTVKQMALMQRLIVGRLTTIALQVESLLGLKPQNGHNAA